MLKKKKTSNSDRPAGPLPLADPSVPLEHRKRMLLHMLADGGPEADEHLQALLEAATAGLAAQLENEKVKQLSQLLDEMQRGPLRSATFDRLLDGQDGVRRARVLMEDGNAAYLVVPDTELASRLRRGDTVMLESQGRVLLAIDEAAIDPVGEVARLERRVGPDRVEILVRDMDRFVYRAAEPLVGKLDRGEALAGCQVLVHTNRRIALDTVPTPEGTSHYWYLVQDRVPDVVVSRDIGSPPPFIEELTEHVRTEMQTPELPRRYRLRRAQTKLLAGVSGTGKTLSIEACIRQVYDVMSEVTGVPIDGLPHRVLRLRMAKVLSKWLGDSDKRLDRFFDEVEQLASEKFVTPDGREFELPVVAIGEEVDGLARARGDGDSVYDRIQTTALERLDMNYRRLSNRLVIFLFTTNVPHLVDAAFLRRAGGTIERFGRLDRRAFSAVLAKHLRDMPLRSEPGGSKPTEREVVREVTDWLFDSNGRDPGQVQLTYVGSTTPDIKHRRDFLTGALVDRAIQQAAAEACRAERLGAEPGLSTERIMSACDCQVRAIVDQLTEYNAGNYLTLPEGSRVAQVRRIAQPRVQPHELARIS